MQDIIVIPLQEVAGNRAFDILNIEFLIDAADNIRMQTSETSLFQQTNLLVDSEHVTTFGL